MGSDDATVLLVDDDPQVVEVYGRQLRSRYRVRTALGGEEALSELDGDVDVVLLDRRMPGLSGDEVLEELRSLEYECGVIMVTAVEPDVDLITMPFNEYLVKPVSRAELVETIERVRMLSTRDIQIQEYFALVAKRRVLEESALDEELAASEEYGELRARLSDLRDRIDPPIEEFEEELASALAEGRPDETASESGDDWIRTLFS